MALSQTQTGLILAGGLLVLTAATAKGAGLKKLGDELVVETDTTVQVRNKQLVISSTPTLKNPTPESIVLFHPFVRIQFEQNTSEPFASSEVKPTKYTLLPNDQLSLEPIVIRIGLASLLRAIPKIAAQIRTEKAISIYVKYIVNLTDRSIPFSMEEVYRLPVGSLDELLKMATG